MELLDEKGFVFLDENNKPFWCSMVEGQPWFYYWHEGNKTWVSLKAVNQYDIWMANKRAMSKESAQMYHDLSDKFCLTYRSRLS